MKAAREGRLMADPVSAMNCTPGEIEAGIAEAIRVHDYPAVVSLLKLLAIRDPYRAEVVYGAMLAVLDGAGKIAPREGDA